MQSDGDDDGRRTPPVDLSEQHRSIDWKVVGGHLFRRLPTQAHERSVSARRDTTGHGILPRVEPSRRASTPSPKRKLAMDEAYRTGTPPLMPRSYAMSEAYATRKQNPQPDWQKYDKRTCFPSNWTAEQLRLMLSGSHAASQAVRPNDSNVVNSTETSISARTPSNRSEAVQLFHSLERNLKNSTSYHTTEQAWRLTFCEIVRQVHVHCTERGELLERVRRWYELEIERLNYHVHLSRDRERKVKESAQAGDAFMVAELESTIAKSSQRLELVKMIMKKTGIRGFGKLIAESFRDAPLTDKHEILVDLLPHVMPLPRTLALKLVSSVSAAGPVDQSMVLQNVYESMEPCNRNEMLVELLASTEGGLDEASAALADMMQMALMQRGGLNGADGAARAQSLVSKIAKEMADTTRGAAIGAILGGGTTEQKATMLGDAFENLPDAEAPKILKEIVEHLGPDDRSALLLPLLREMSSSERCSLLNNVMQSIPCEEVASVLKAKEAEIPSLLAAMSGGMLTSIIAEAPSVVDSALLVGSFSPEQLLQWVHSLVGASPEDACRVWLTQILQQLRRTSSDSALSQQLVGAVGPEVFAYAYSNLSLDARLCMLSAIQEIKQQGAISPAPFSKQEVEHIASLLDLQNSSSSPQSTPEHSPVQPSRQFMRKYSVAAAVGARRGSVLGPLPSKSTGSMRLREKLPLIPLEQTIRGVADIYIRKIKDDQQSDSKSHKRCSMNRFVRSYLVRQYGMKAMAERALRELTSTIRAYGSGGDQSLVRIRMFGEMNGMLKDSKAKERPPWPDRKTDFFLYVLQRLAPRSKEGGNAGSSARSSGPEAASKPGHMMRRGSMGGAGGRRGSMAVASTQASLWASPPASGLKDMLCREDVVVPKTSVDAMVSGTVLDGELRSKVNEQLRDLAMRDADSHDLHLDDVLEIMMHVWDEQEQQNAPQIDELIRDAFHDAVSEGHERMTFSQFEMFCTSLPHQTMDDDVILDLFDDAIRVTGECLGEESDNLSLEGFAQVARLHSLVSLQQYSKLVNPVTGNAQAPIKQGRDAAGGAALDKEISRIGARGRRTVVKTAPSKANDKGGAHDKRQTAATQKPESVYRVIWSAVQAHFLFRHLDNAMYRELVQRMIPVPVMPGHDVIRQGDKGDYFYVAESGTFDVIVNDEKVHTYVSYPEEEKYPCFGELALLYAKPRAATIRAAGPGMLWALDRRGFRSVQMCSSGVDLTKLLKKMDILSSLQFNALQALMNHMNEQTFRGGEHVFHEGDEGNSMYVIMSGTAIVTRSKSTSTGAGIAEGIAEEEEEEIMQLEEEMYFGERALLESAPRAASVRALTTLKCMVIDRATFERLLGPLQHIIDQDRQRRELEAAAQKMQLEAAGLSGASFSSFRFLAPVMRLDSGGILVVHHAVSNEPYTVRAESKSKLFELEQTDRVKRELELMSAAGLCGHLPMLPAMLCTFASPLALFALFKTRISCDLSHFMDLSRGGLSIERVRFTAACVVAALERLHSRVGAIYRNLSPDSLAVDENGYVCLMDYRHAKALCGNKTFTLCGAADYLSPEQVTCAGHGFPADFWAVGVLLWETVVGEGPWGSDSNEMNTYKRITDHNAGALGAWVRKGRGNGLRFPDTLSPHLVDLIDQLLVPEPLARLGATSVVDESRDGFDKLKEHAWFDGLRWTQLLEGLLPSPFLSSAATHMRELIDSLASRSSDTVLGELVGSTEFSGDGSWFAQY